MSDVTDRERERLSQAKLRAWLNRDMRLTEMVTVCLSEYKDSHNHGIYCALIPTARIEKSLSNPCWDLMHGRGLPGATLCRDDAGNDCAEYLRFGDWHVEPLVIDREFHGMRPDYKELSEEFRLFHRLYHDRDQDHYIKIDDDGNEHLVAIVEPNRVHVRLQEIRQFLAIKEMHLAIQFDCREHSTHTLEELGLQPVGGDQREHLLCWGLHYGSFHGLGGEHQSFSRLLGKRVIPPLPKEKSGFWGFAEAQPRKHEEFIIDVDEDGDEVTHTSDPDGLANYFGANPGAPHYLTPVFFRRGVLDKYYHQSSKFSVEDSSLHCGSLWGMTMDNHHDEYVVAWLGDLGRDLPYEEQLHWRSFNIAPCGGVSEVFFKRQIEAQFADSDQPDVALQYLFPEFCAQCLKRLGWSVFLPLAAKDQHYFKSLRIPASNEQKEFDELVLALAKVLVDSINEKELLKLIPAEEREGLIGGISRLERALVSRGAGEHGVYIQFLRDLQELRSTGSAHRKGRKYEKVAKRFTSETGQLPKVFRAMLVAALNMTAYLQGIIEAGLFDDAAEAKSDASEAGA